MNTNPVFSLQRFSLVFKRHMMFNQKLLLIAFAASGGLLLTISLISTYGNGGVFTTELFSSFGMVLVFVMGFLVTSNIFQELHTPAKGQFFLTLPASSFEKVATAWIISAPLYILAAYIGLVVFSLLSSLLSAILFGSAVMIFNPFVSPYLEVAGVYLVTQSIFFLGAVYFRKHNFLKTLLALWVVQMAFGLILGLAAYLIFGTTNINMNTEDIAFMPPFFVEWVPVISKIVFWGIIGPFFLIVSYIRFKEREV